MYCSVWRMSNDLGGCLISYYVKATAQPRGRKAGLFNNCTKKGWWKSRAGFTFATTIWFTAAAPVIGGEAFDLLNMVCTVALTCVKDE